MTESIQGMARRLDKAFAEGPEAMKAMLGEIVARHGRDTALAAFAELQRRRNGQWAEKVAEHEAYTAHHNEMMRLLRACPEGTKLDAAARIMAARGDKFALDLVAHFDSREYRLESALTDAAVELHPGWRDDHDGSFTKLDPSAPEPPELIEWLYKNHPARARAVEQSVPDTLEGPIQDGLF